MKEQLLIRVGKGCNYKCKFCNVADLNEKTIGAKENYRQLIEQFHKKMKVANITNLDVTITGGEPSLFKKEVFFIITYILKYCAQKNIKALIEMQTNATLFNDAFTSWLVRHEVDNFLISFHTIDREVFQTLLGVDYDQYFERVVSNIKLIQSKNVYVSLNVIMTKMNYDNYLDTIRFALKEFQGAEIEMGVVQPNGYGEINISELYMDYESLYRKYNYALFLVKRSIGDVVSHYCGLPLCYMYKPSFSLEKKINTELRQEHVLKEKFLINKLNDASKSQSGACNTCRLNNVCSGIWKNYVGKQKLRPLSYIVDFFSDFQSNEYAYKILHLEEDIKKLYDSNKRQILVPSSLGTKDEIYNLLKKLTGQGFYKISLLIDSDFELEESLFSTGVSNIQIDISQIDISFLDKIIDFSSLYKPQFRIDVDILIFEYSQSHLLKIQNLVEKLPNHFFKLFFIYDYKNTNVLQYKKYLSTLGDFSSYIFTVNFYKPLLYKNI